MYAVRSSNEWLTRGGRQSIPQSLGSACPCLLVAPSGEFWSSNGHFYIGRECMGERGAEYDLLIRPSRQLSVHSPLKQTPVSSRE